MHVNIALLAICPEEAGHGSCHMAMECVVYNVYVRLLTFNLSYRFQCTYNGAHHLTVVLSRSHHFNLIVNIIVMEDGN